MIITDMSPETVDLLLDWMYTEYRDEVSFDQWTALFKASHKYHIAELQQTCERVLSESVSKHTYLQLNDLAACFDCARLQQASLVVS